MVPAAGYLPTREPLLTFLQDSANENGYACTLVWAVSHYSTDAETPGYLYGSNDGQGYVFGYNGDGAKAVLQQYAYMQNKASGCRQHIFFAAVL